MSNDEMIEGEVSINYLYLRWILLKALMHMSAHWCILNPVVHWFNLSIYKNEMQIFQINEIHILSNSTIKCIGYFTI